MEFRLVASTLRSWPDARAVRDNDGWLIASAGERGEVLPLGVHNSGEWGNKPQRLGLTLHEAHDQLREIDVLEEAQAAQRLAELVRTLPAPLLCREHGLATRHQRDGSKGCPVLMHDGHQAMRVASVANMITGMDGIRSLAFHLATQRKPASRRMTENALTWPLMPDFLRAIVAAELQRDGELWVGRGRQIVTSSLRAAFDHSDLVLGFEWGRNSRPQMVLHAHTDMAAYVADFARHVIDATVGEGLDLSVTCEACRQPYMPRRQPQPGSAFCSRVECQRERQRRNQARSRSRRKAPDDQHSEA